MRRRLSLTLLRAALAVPIGAVAALAGPAGALACSPPAPVDGQVMGFSLVARPGADPVVLWRQYRDVGMFPTRSAVLSGGSWRWAEPSAPPEPDLRGLPEAAHRTWSDDAAGNGVAVWRDGPALLGASRPAGGIFGAPATIGADEPVEGSIAIGLGAGGHAVAVWTERLVETTGPDAGLERLVVRTADRAPDGTWSAPSDLAPPDAPRDIMLTSCDQPGALPVVAVDPAGDAVAAWRSWVAEPRGLVTLWAARPAGGAWSAPAVLAAGPVDSLRLAVDAAGDAQAAWTERGEARWARRPAGGAFGPSEVLGPAGGEVALRLEADGRSLAVWRSGLRRLSAVTRPAGGPWSAPADLTALEKPPHPIGIVEPIDRWFPVPLLRRVRISRQTLRQPACALRRGAPRRACRSAGVALTFRLGVPGEVRVIVQRRGKGRALRGVRIAAGAGEHRIVVAARPLPPGRYTVRIRVTAEGRIAEAASKRLLVLARA